MFQFLNKLNLKQFMSNSHYVMNQNAQSTYSDLPAAKFLIRDSRIKNYFIPS